jgi:tight adherence protein C
MAGYRGAGAEYAFLSFRLVAPIAFFLAAIIYQFLIIKWSQPAMVKIGIAVAATYLGIKAPELFLRTRPASGRRNSSARFLTP